MSNSMEDIAMEMYLEEEYRKDVIDGFRAENLKRYFLKHPNLLQKARERNIEAIRMIGGKHFSASYVFNHSAIELLIKNVILLPLLHGNILDEKLAEYLSSEVLKRMRTNEYYSKLLSRFTSTYAEFDIKRYGEKEVNLISEFRQIQDMRNDILHKGLTISREKAIAVNDISILFYDMFKELLVNLGLRVDEKSWIIERVES